MTLNDLEHRNHPYFSIFHHFDRFSGRLYYSGLYCVCFSPFLLLPDFLVNKDIHIEDRPITSVKCCLPVGLPVFYIWRKLERTLQRGLSAIAEHLVLDYMEFDVFIGFVYF